jgi:hypothetical protein
MRASRYARGSVAALVDRRMCELTELEAVLLAACRMALRQLDYDGDDKTAFTGATWEALTKAIVMAEASKGESPSEDNVRPYKSRTTC